MNENKNLKTGGGIGIGGIWLIMFWAALGYFTYDGLEGAFAIVILSTLFNLATLLSLIPFVGVIIQVLVMYFLIQPWVFYFTGITGTWLTSLIFWINIIFGCIITLATTFFTLLVFWKK